MYESPCTHWAVDGTPRDFGHELLPDDLARMEHNMAQAIESVPVLGRAGIRRVVNGPMIFSPDLNPLVGPLPGLRNYWCACGVMTAFSQAGAVGKVLTEWMTNGDPGPRFLHVGRDPVRRLGRPRVHHGPHRRHVLHPLPDPLPVARSARPGVRCAPRLSIRC